MEVETTNRRTVMASKRITLTDDEITTIAMALRIAAEDGSIFGANDHDDETNALIDSIYKKLNRRQ